jgi:predicted nucleic acid-binding protein
MVLIDTSAWIHWLRPGGDNATGDAVDAALESGEAAWCEMVRLELWNGAGDAAQQKALRRLEATLPQLSISDVVWDDARTCARRARAKGVTAPATDVLIFACARHYNALLLHADEDFEHLRKAIG